MTEKEIELIVDLVLARHPVAQCSAEGCGERCGFPPSEHANKHIRAERLCEMVEQGEKIAKNTAVKVFVGAIIVVFGTGTVITVAAIWSDLVKKVPGLGGG